VISYFREKNEDMTREVERLKKGLAVKEDLERNQIESVKNLR